MLRILETMKSKNPKMFYDVIMQMRKNENFNKTSIYTPKECEQMGQFLIEHQWKMSEKMHHIFYNRLQSEFERMAVETYIKSPQKAHSPEFRQEIENANQRATRLIADIEGDLIEAEELAELIEQKEEILNGKKSDVETSWSKLVNSVF